MKKILMVAMAVSTLFVTSAKAAKLADKETMSMQLASVTADAYLAENFFPMILEYADSEKIPMGIVMMFFVAQDDFSKKVLRGMPLMAQRAVQRNLNKHIPQFITAILPNDAKEAEEAIATWRQFNE